MTQQNVLELAKQGDPQAIAALMNRSLQPQGITAKAILKDFCLQIMLEAEQVPNQQAQVSFIRKGLKDLNAKSIEKVKIYGKQVGEEFPTWNQEFELVAKAHSAPSPVSSSSTISSRTPQKKASSSSDRFSFSPDTASLPLVIIGCVITGLLVLAINPFLFILSCGLAMVPAKIASDKGRKFLNWWCYGFLLFVIAFIHALAIKEDEATVLSQGTMKKCPNCAEIVKAEAKICRYCSRELELPMS